MREVKNSTPIGNSQNIRTQTDLNYMDDQQYQSAQNLDDISNSSNLQPFGSKIIRKKPSKIQQKTNLNSKSVLRRPSSQVNSQKVQKNQKRIASKVYNKKNPELKEIKIEEFDYIYRTFNIFSSFHIGFNETILGLKCLGIEIESQKRFQMIKNIFDEMSKNIIGIDFEMFLKLSIKMLKQQKAKQNSNIKLLEKDYYYMIEQGNGIKFPFQTNKQSQKQFYNHFKSYVQKLSSQQRYLTQDSIKNLVEYLSLQKQFSRKDIHNIIRFLDKQDKGYLTFEDLLRSIEQNRLINS